MKLVSIFTAIFFSLLVFPIFANEPAGTIDWENELKKLDEEKQNGIISEKTYNEIYDLIQIMKKEIKKIEESIKNNEHINKLDFKLIDWNAFKKDVIYFSEQKIQQLELLYKKLCVLIKEEEADKYR